MDVGKRFSKLHRRKNPRSTDKDSRWWDFLDFPAGDFDLLAAIAVVIVAVLLLWFLVFPLLLILIDVVLVVVLFLTGLAARVLLRRPWTVVATRTDGVEIEREVVGWRASRDEIAAMRQQIEQGLISPTEPTSPYLSPEQP